MEKIRNWKVVEILDQVEIISEDGRSLKYQLLEEFGIPTPDFINGLDRQATEINWKQMSSYFKFCFDNTDIDDKIKGWFKNTKLINSSKVLLFYGQEKLAVKIPTNTFIEEWEDFFQSTGFETLIFSEDFKLIMEVTRDYNLHSNFEIYKVKEKSSKKLKL